jgi:hypothetical protein
VRARCTRGDGSGGPAAVAACFFSAFSYLSSSILSGCATIDVPSYSVRTPTAEVYASTIDDAARVANQVELAVPHLRSVLGTNRTGIRIALLDTEIPGPAVAHCTALWIVVGREAQGHQYERIVIAHELAHWLAVDHWDVLSGPMEEGLAIYLSLAVEASDPGTWERDLTGALHRYVQDPAAKVDIEHSLRLRPRTFRRTTFARHPDKTPLQGLGYLLVAR